MSGNSVVPDILTQDESQGDQDYDMDFVQEETVDDATDLVSTSQDDIRNLLIRSPIANDADVQQKRKRLINDESDEESSKKNKKHKKSKKDKKSKHSKKSKKTKKHNDSEEESQRSIDSDDELTSQSSQSRSQSGKKKKPIPDSYQRADNARS